MIFLHVLIACIFASCRQEVPRPVIAQHTIVQSPRENISAKEENSDIPLYVLETLTYIRKQNRAPQGFVGGRKFYNREKKLPIFVDEKKIFYREWDVRKKVRGRNRGPERLITSSKHAYYTPDHYRTFILIKEK